MIVSGTCACLYEVCEADLAPVLPVLRLKIGDKAVCYFRCAADPYKNRKEALAWTSAINLQWEVNT